MQQAGSLPCLFLVLLQGESKMVRISIAMLKEAGYGLTKTLSDILVCPLTKNPLRYCPKTDSFISDQIGVSFPIVNGIPCLVPKDGKILEDNEVESVNDSFAMKEGSSKD